MTTLEATMKAIKDDARAIKDDCREINRILDRLPTKDDLAVMSGVCACGAAALVWIVVLACWWFST